MSNKDDDSSDDKSKARSWVDLAAKVAAPLAVLVAAWIAYEARNFQSVVSATNLINQRETAESDLRAAVFESLISPIIGSGDGGTDLSSGREHLLVEMLSLNFSEHIELKPLLREVDAKLAKESANSEATNSGSTPFLLDDYCRNQKTWANPACRRRSLRSVANRIRDRQINMLRMESQRGGFTTEPIPLYFKLKESAKSTKEWEEKASVLASDCQWSLSVGTTSDIPLGLQPPERAGSDKDCKIEKNTPTNPAAFWQDGASREVCVPFPRIKRGARAFSLQDALTVSVREVNDEDDEVEVVVGFKPEGKWLEPFQFKLTRFDFPLTDNTALSSQYRFALVVDKIDEVERTRIEPPKRCLPEEVSVVQRLTKAVMAWFERDKEPTSESKIPAKDGREETSDVRRSDGDNSTDRETTSKIVTLKLVWFPPNYITARERPTNYREIRSILKFE